MKPVLKVSAFIPLVPDFKLNIGGMLITLKTEKEIKLNFIRISVKNLQGSNKPNLLNGEIKQTP